MRFQKTHLNYEFYDEHYLTAMRCKSVGKNVRIHRSTVMEEPENVTFGDDVVIEPYTVLRAGRITLENGVKIGSHVTISGNVTISKDVTNGIQIEGFVDDPPAPTAKPEPKTMVWGEEDVGAKEKSKK